MEHWGELAIQIEVTTEGDPFITAYAGTDIEFEQEQLRNLYLDVYVDSDSTEPPMALLQSYLAGKREAPGLDPSPEVAES